MPLARVRYLYEGGEKAQRLTQAGAIKRLGYLAKIGSNPTRFVFLAITPENSAEAQGSAKRSALRACARDAASLNGEGNDVARGIFVWRVHSLQVAKSASRAGVIDVTHRCRPKAIAPGSVTGVAQCVAHTV